MSSEVLILFSGLCTVWMLSVLHTFWRYILPLSSGSVWVGWVGVYRFLSNRSMRRKCGGWGVVWANRDSEQRLWKSGGCERVGPFRVTKGNRKPLTTDFLKFMNQCCITCCGLSCVEGARGSPLSQWFGVDVPLPRHTSFNQHWMWLSSIVLGEHLDGWPIGNSICRCFLAHLANVLILLTFAVHWPFGCRWDITHEQWF
jgi:hypothetical protein